MQLHVRPWRGFSHAFEGPQSPVFPFVKLQVIWTGKLRCCRHIFPVTAVVVACCCCCFAWFSVVVRGMCVCNLQGPTISCCIIPGMCTQSWWSNQLGKADLVCADPAFQQESSPNTWWFWSQNSSYDCSLISLIVHNFRERTEIQKLAVHVKMSPKMPKASVCSSELWGCHDFAAAFAAAFAARVRTSENGWGWSLCQRKYCRHCRQQFTCI